MPKRTTPFQMVVHFLRKHTATPGVTVTESKELVDPTINEPREVDVVVEGNFDGEAVVTSIEVIDHKRPADITWVEQQINKHRHLPTNRLVLVSKSGFSKTAIKRVAVEGGWVQAMTPRPADGTLSMFADVAHMTPTGCRFLADHPGYGPSEYSAEAGVLIFDTEGHELGSTLELAREFISQPAIVRTFTVSAHHHPERDALEGFAVGANVEGLGYHLRDDDKAELHPLLAVGVQGKFAFEQSEVPFAYAELGGRKYGSGEAEIGGRPAVWVATTDEATDTTTISWRTKDDKPLFTPPVATPKFPGLAALNEKDVELTDPGA